MASHCGYIYGERGRVWRAQARRELSHGISYVDGFRLSPVKLNRRSHALSINPHVYFFENGANTPSDKPMWDLIPISVTPRLTPLSTLLEQLRSFHRQLVDAGCGIADEPVKLQSALSDLLSSIHLLAGPRAVEHIVSSPLGRVFQQYGFEHAPADLTLYISSPEDFGDEVNGYGRFISDAFARLHVRCRVLTNDWAELMHSVENRRAGASPFVVLVGVHGKKGDPLSNTTLSALALLDENVVPYRLFSLENKAMKWSSFDQSAILVEASGGSAFSLDLPHREDLPPLIFIGLDLGHPLRKKESWVVATIVDGSGHLRGYWRSKQDRDETLRRGTLEAALTWLYLHLRKRYGGNYRPVVLRDGRMFETRPSIYSQFFKDGYSLVEVIKHPVPLMLAGDACARAGTMCVPSGSDFAFVLTSGAKTERR